MFYFTWPPEDCQLMSGRRLLHNKRINDTLFNELFTLLGSLRVRGRDRSRVGKKPAKKTLPQMNSNKDLLIYLFLLIKENKKWWLLPLLFVLALLGLFVGLTGNQSILPAIYAFF